MNERPPSIPPDGRPSTDGGARLRANLRRTYRRVAPVYDLLDLPFEHGRYRQVRPAVFEPVAGARTLLDCGVGTGRNTPYYPPGAQVVGVDLSNEMLGRARRRAAGAGRAAAWIQADVTRLPLREATFDAATATFLFCVLPDALQHAALRELARVVKPGGRVVLLEYVLSARPLRRWLTKTLWAPWVRFAYGAGFERRTTEHVQAAGFTIEERRFVYADTILLLVARNPPSVSAGDPTHAMTTVMADPIASEFR